MIGRDLKDGEHRQKHDDEERAVVERPIQLICKAV